MGPLKPLDPSVAADGDTSPRFAQGGVLTFLLPVADGEVSAQRTEGS